MITPKDKIIGDFIDMEIGMELSLPTLYALEAIFFQRLQLAQVRWEANESMYEEICCDRFEQISKVLTMKYDMAESLDERIKILNHLENISVTLGHGNSEFVVNRRQELMNFDNLTFSQKYRLDNLLGFNYDNITEEIGHLLVVAESAFVMAILFGVDSLSTSTQYSAVMELYETMFNKAVAERNISEVANLLTTVAFCNSDPNRRQMIKELTDRLISGSSLAIELSLPVLRVNSIAAEVYSQIDKITGKYDILSA